MKLTFSLVSDTDVECFNCKFKIPYEQILVFLSFMNIFRRNRSLK